MSPTRDWPKLLISALLLPAALLTAACDDSASPGTLIVDWSIATSCSSADISEVVVRLMFSGTQEEYDSQKVDCGVGSATFAHVTPGTYDVRLEGLDDKGTWLYAGETKGVGVPEGQTVEPQAVALTQRRGAIDLSWYFEKGLCSSNKVAKVQIAIFDAGLNQLFATELAQPFDCDPFGLPGAVRVVGESPDPSYTSNGILIGSLLAGDYVVHLFGLDETGAKKYKAKTSVSAKRGQVTDLQLQLVPCNSDKVPDLSCN
jgi:hypothetical protein